MDHSTEQEFPEQPTLMTLNDHCLIQILENVKLNDLVNLNQTCRRLKDICSSVCSLRFSNTIMSVLTLVGFGEVCGDLLSKKEFKRYLSVIGDHITAFKLYDDHNVMDKLVKILGQKCKNIKSLTFSWLDQPLYLQGFTSLKELIIDGSEMGIEEWKNCFACIPDLESLSCLGQSGCSELLTMLPKLKRLALRDIDGSFHLSQGFQHVLRLDGLTKFSFSSEGNNCNELLIGLAKQLNLVELDIKMDFNAATFKILKSFKHLEVLSMDNFSLDSCDEKLFSDASAFPAKLKRIKIGHLKISYKVFLSIIRELQFLEEFDIWRNIYWNRHKPVNFWNSSNVIDGIEAELRGERRQRKLKIIFCDLDMESGVCIHDSFNLHIVNSTEFEDDDDIGCTVIFEA